MTQNTIREVLTALLQAMGVKKKNKSYFVLPSLVHCNNSCLISSQNIYIQKSLDKFVPTFYTGPLRHKSHLITVRFHYCYHKKNPTIIQDTVIQNHLEVFGCLLLGFSLLFWFLF